MLAELAAAGTASTPLPPGSPRAPSTPGLARSRCGTSDCACPLALRSQDAAPLLRVRHLLILCALAEVYRRTGCPPDGRVWGEPATYHGLAIRSGAGGIAGSARGAVGRTRVSLLWLAEHGWVAELESLPRYGAHRRVEPCPACQRRASGHRAFTPGCPDCRPTTANHVRLSASAADLVARGGLPALRLPAVRRLSGDATALRLYAWLRLRSLAGVPCPARDRDFTIPLGLQVMQSDRNPYRFRQQLRRAVTEVESVDPEIDDLLRPLFGDLRLLATLD